VRWDGDGNVGYLGKGVDKKIGSSTLHVWIGIRIGVRLLNMS